MAAFLVKAHVADDGTVTLRLPDDFPRGEVQLEIQVEADSALPAMHLTRTDAELAELWRALELIEPSASGADVVEWLRTQPAWEGEPLPDGEAWVEEQRRKRRERNRW